MKFFYNAVLAMVCFILSNPKNLKAQDERSFEIESSQYLMQTCLLGPDTVGQSFYHSGSDSIYSISFAVHDLRAIEDRLGKLIIFAGEGLGGQIVFDTIISIPGINKFYPSWLMETVTNSNQDISLWMSVRDSILSGYYTFEEVKTEYVINKYLPEGQYTVIVTTDKSFPDVYGSGEVYAPELACFLNCTRTSDCGNDTVLNPYSYGQMVVVSQTSFNPLNKDLAFEVKTRQVLTEVTESDVNKFNVSIQDGDVLIPNDWQGADVLVSNVLGQSRLYRKVQVGQLIRIFPKQVSIVCILRNRIWQTAKIVIN